MRFLEDECGQGSAEYVLLFGGVIVIAVAALMIYRQYLNSASPFFTNPDLVSVRSTVGS